MKTKQFLFPLAVAICFSVVLIAFAEIEAIDPSGAWRLPFDGTHMISCGPHEGNPGCKHVLTSGNDSREAIDYPAIPPGRPPFQVIAPANGTVLDICETTDFGTVLRIYHNGVYSFFAHLSSVSVVANQPVKQGNPIAMTGTSGTGGSNNHLHFEARNGDVDPCGNGSGAYTGSTYPIRALPGQWWNTWYSPPPNFQRNATLISGGAQYPERKRRPTVTSLGARHLSNNQSPPNVLAGWMSNVNTSAVTLHFGAAPDTPGTNWATVFSVYEFRQGCNCWSAIPGGPDITGPWWTVHKLAVGTNPRAMVSIPITPLTKMTFRLLPVTFYAIGKYCLRIQQPRFRISPHRTAIPQRLRHCNFALTQRNTKYMKTMAVAHRLRSMELGVASWYIGR